jgi:hypothetical protein
MPADYERAVAFILAHGSDADLYTLKKFRIGYNGPSGPVPHDSEVEKHWLEGRHADGGWAPFWARDYSSLDATCYRLAQADLAWLLRFKSFGPALEFLRSRQRQDGSWEEDESVRDLAPPWAKPGDLAAQLYLTANCGWWLINARAYGFPDYETAATKAGAYLEQYQAENGSLPSFLQTHWLTAGLWIRLEWGQPDLPEQAMSALDYLATQLDVETPAGALGWMLTTLAPLGVSKEHPAIVKAVALLDERQRPDGGWTSEDGPERDAWVTMQALLALIQWEAGVPDGLSEPEDTL